MLRDRKDVCSHQGAHTGPLRPRIQTPLPLLFRKGAIHLLEVDFVHLELGFKDPRSQDTAAEQILKQNQGQWVSPKPIGTLIITNGGQKCCLAQKEGLPVLAVRTFAYLVAGHIVSLLDDINLVQEAGRKKIGTRGVQSYC